MKIYAWVDVRIISFIYTVFEAKRFAEELSEEESSKRIRNAVPKSTEYKTQWGVRMFETCKRERSNDNVKNRQITIGLEVSNVET